MDDIERRESMKAAALGALAFTVGGAQVMLTPRETTILDLIARGDSYGGVARTLSVSVSAVSSRSRSAKIAANSAGDMADIMASGGDARGKEVAARFLLGS